MTLLDTSVVIERVKAREPIREDITAVTFVEYPKIVLYKHFYGGIVFPIREDFVTAHRMQLELLNTGSPQALADLLVAAIAINRDEEVVTRDKDFKYILEAAKRLGYDMKLKLL